MYNTNVYYWLIIYKPQKYNKIKNGTIHFRTIPFYLTKPIAVYFHLLSLRYV